MSASPKTLLVRAITLAALLIPASAQAATGGVCAQPQYAVDAPPLLEFNPDIVLTADEVSLDKEGLSKLLGAVRLRQGGKEFSAESIDYDDAQRRVRVTSESLFRNQELIIKSREAEFDLNAESGSFIGSEFTLPSRAAHGSSDRITLFREGTAQLKNTAYTTCSPDSRAWFLEASDIKLDHQEGLGTARNAVLHFANVPVLYLPYFQFPIDDRRRTGLLFPTIGQSSKTGFEMMWPVYVNLAPNYDATITPRLMTERGLQMGTNFRYLLAQGEGHAKYEYLDDHDFGKDRSQFQYQHTGLINRRLGLEVNYNEVSDRNYFEDLGASFELASITHIERSATLTYQAPAAYTVKALVQGFQPIASSLQAVDDPYKRLPQITLNAFTKNSLLETRAGFTGEFVNFARENSVEGMRVDLQPFLRFLHERQAYYFTSQADLRYTGYKLTGIADGQPESPDRTLPIVSAEGGLRYERITGDGSIQTLEPRVFGLYVPYKNQDDLPLFDTGEPDFDFVELFARNRFSGNDRVSDARHIAGAVTTRMLDPQSGEALWSVSFGQLYRFAAPQVDLPDFPAPNSGATEFIGQVDYRLTKNWLAVLSSQWSPEQSEFERSNIALRYRDPDHSRRFDAAYRYRRGILEQTDVSFSVPVIAGFRMAARSRYSLDAKKSLETLAGLEYETCCWTVRGSYRRYIANTSGEFDSGIYLQLELKGLTEIGTDYNPLMPSDDLTADAY